MPDRPDVPPAFEHLGAPYLRAGWGSNVVGVLLDGGTDWDKLSELLTDSYCIQAPAALSDTVARPPDPPRRPRSSPTGASRVTGWAHG